SCRAAAAPTLDFPDEAGPSRATTRPGWAVVTGRGYRPGSSAPLRRSREIRRAPIVAGSPAATRQTPHLRRLEGSHLAAAQAVNPHGADPDADEAIDRRLDGPEHPPQLA